MKVGSGRPVYLYTDLLCARSGYFRTSLLPGTKQARDIPWTGSAMKCEAFLFWLGQEKPESCFNSSCAMQFLACCAYFQVTEEYWELVQREVTLPAAYSQTTEEMKTVWVREKLPFTVMKKIVERVPSKLQRLVFMFAWFNEKTATTPSDKQALQTCADFYQMHDLAIAMFPPLPKLGFGPMRVVSPQQVLALFSPFPLAANCLETVWLLEQLTTGAFCSE